MNHFDDETPRYKKKSIRKPPKKANHKHIFEPCIIEYPDDWWKKEHERSDEKRLMFAGYCPICGKVGETDRSRWWAEVQSNRVSFLTFEQVPTEEGARELNPETRTLPTFQSDSIFTKFVKID